VRWRQSLIVAGVITVGIFTVARMRAQTKTPEDYVQDTRLDQIDKHVSNTDLLVTQNRDAIENAEKDFIRLEAKNHEEQAANHDEDVKWHEAIFSLITASAAALKFVPRKRPARVE
jgi:hypothetical protein